NGDWSRNGPTKCALRSIENSDKMNQEYLDNIMRYHKCLQGKFVVDCFGVTRDPTTGCYMFVMKFFEENLYQYIERVKRHLLWEDIIGILCEIIDGLKRIHDNGLYHGNLHGGNLLIENGPESVGVRISDIGLHGPANKTASTPKAYLTLMKRCWHHEPSERPKTAELSNILHNNPIQNLLNTANNDRVISEYTILNDQIVHPNAIYNSHLLDFLPLHDNV
ncbi:7463_t:CDS:2, partial [Dentiscutata heterogama]